MNTFIEAVARRSILWLILSGGPFSERTRITFRGVASPYESGVIDPISGVYGLGVRFLSWLRRCFNDEARAFRFS